MAMNRKMQNKYNEMWKRKWAREKENFLQTIDYCVCLLEKREKNQMAGSTNGTIIYLSNARTYTRYKTIGSITIRCVCAVYFDHEPIGKTDPSNNCSGIWKRFEPFKVGWWLWFAIAICLSSAIFFWLFFLLLFLWFVCKISRIFCRRMTRPMHIFSVFVTTMNFVVCRWIPVKGKWNETCYFSTFFSFFICRPECLCVLLFCSQSFSFTLTGFFVLYRIVCFFHPFASLQIVNLVVHWNEAMIYWTVNGKFLLSAGLFRF